MLVEVSGALPDWCNCQGSCPGNHRATRHSRRDWPCDRICRRGSAESFNGRTHDALQYEYRGGRACRHDRA
jgi:hypothetical protein